MIKYTLLFQNSIGFSIAKKLALDGSKVMVSSRKQENVERAIASLQSEVGNLVDGIVCHVGKEEDRKRLVKEVSTSAIFYDVVLIHFSHIPRLVFLMGEADQN